MQEMLWQKGVNWNDYPSFFKRGTFVQRRKTKRPFTAEELDRLPKRHKAKTDPDNQFFERNECIELEMPPFTKVVNRAEVIFFGEEPRTQAEEAA
jgi:tRNA(His) 5'-end guanylyltransferase